MPAAVAADPARALEDRGGERRRGPRPGTRAGRARPPARAGSRSGAPARSAGPARERRRGPEGDRLGAEELLVGEGVEGRGARPGACRPRRPRAAAGAPPRSAARARRRAPAVPPPRRRRPARHGAPPAPRRGARRRAQRPPETGLGPAHRRHAERVARLRNRHQRHVHLHHAGELLQHLVEGLVGAHRAVDGLERTAQLLGVAGAARARVSTVNEGSSRRRSRAIASRRTSITSWRTPSSWPASRPSTSRSRRSMFMRRECTPARPYNERLWPSIRRPASASSSSAPRTSTAARRPQDLYRDDPRYEVRSAGVAPFATVPLTRDLLLWADRVFVMNEREDQHRTLIRDPLPRRGPAARGPRRRGPLAPGRTRTSSTSCCAGCGRTSGARGHDPVGA